MCCFRGTPACRQRRMAEGNGGPFSSPKSAPQERVLLGSLLALVAAAIVGIAWLEGHLSSLCHGHSVVSPVRLSVSKFKSYRPQGHWVPAALALTRTSLLDLTASAETLLSDETTRPGAEGWGSTDLFEGTQPITVGQLPTCSPWASGMDWEEDKALGSGWSG